MAQPTAPTAANTKSQEKSAGFYSFMSIAAIGLFFGLGFNIIFLIVGIREISDKGTRIIILISCLALEGLEVVIFACAFAVIWAIDARASKSTN